MSDKHRFDDTDFREVIPEEEKSGKRMPGAGVDSAEGSEAEEADFTEESEAGEMDYMEELEAGDVDFTEELDSEEMDYMEESEAGEMDFTEEAEDMDGAEEEESEGIDLIELLGLKKGKGNGKGKGKGRNSSKASQAKAKKGGDSSDESEYEDICYICHRPESKAGAMIKVASKICICSDCMQKTFDSMNHIGFPLGDMSSFGNMPNISMINLSDLQNMDALPRRQKLKKKKSKEEKKTASKLDIKSISVPHKIKASLDEYVVGQEYAKKVMAVAVYNHYKRVACDSQDGVEIEKSNMLMVGPTGSGKTYLVRTLAQLLDVPLAIADATSLTEAGYIGDDIESVVSKLLAAADNDVERAEHGIIFIDEIDKIAKKRNTNQRDVSGESVQQGMLKLLEGAEIEVPVGANSKNAMVPLATVNTRDILFICGGAFPDLDGIIKERLNKKSSLGFHADLKDKYDKEENIMHFVEVEDIRKYGMIPEFLGRLPIVFALDALSEDMLVQILTEPKNAIVKQYQKLLAIDEVKLEFEEGALRAIARRAKEKDVGARALRAIIEEFMLDIMYEIPKDDNIGTVTITEGYIEKTGGPLIQMRG